jgi:hypothetical protein
MKATINNTFHNTSKNVILKDGKNVIGGRRLKDWERSLCGIKGCCCSGLGGLRGDADTPAIVSDYGGFFEYDAECDRRGNEYLIINAVKLAD